MGLGPRSPVAATLVVVLAVVLAGCGTPVALRTAPVAEDVCMDALAAGVLVPSAQSGLALQAVAGRNELIEVLWPFGYSAMRGVDGKLTLLDRSRKEIAHEGDTITMAGGFDAKGVWTACGGTVENAPAI